MKKIILLPILLVFIFVSCRKTELTGQYADYVGSWSSETTELDFTADGKGDYIYQSGALTKTITGGRILIKGSSLKIKAGVTGMFKKSYNIDTPPTLVSSPDDAYYYYKMVLDGEVFTRY